MITFIIGIIILVTGALLYGWLCEKIIRPSDAPTPAVKMTDGIDYVPMKKWRNSLINLLNIAGTGPILGPIQGILFGPIAFITIPIGCVIGGAFHDYMCGMISVRYGGKQMPDLVKFFIGKKFYWIFNLLVYLSMPLAATVFIYTPGDLFVTHVTGGESTLQNPTIWLVYALIIIYYIIATLFPIDKIIGKIYPIFGAIVLLSAVGVFFGLFFKGFRLDEIWESGFSFINPYGDRFIPVFFVTVACGIVSGFHSTQVTLISRTLKSEREGRMTFYNMMIIEGFIAMVWAAAAMGAVNIGLLTNDTLHDSPVLVVGTVAKSIFGNAGGMIAIIGVIILAITSGDTCTRSLRILLADVLHIDTRKKKNNLLLAIPIFAVIICILIFAKSNTSGFNILWRYFSWENECFAVFTFTIISMYMKQKGMPFFMALIPGMFYLFVISSYILSAKTGIGLPWTAGYVIATLVTILYGFLIVSSGKKPAG